MAKKTNKKRKGQIRIGESIAVMIVFFFMLMFGYAFYGRMQQQDYAATIKDNSEKEAIQVAQKIYFLPELQCSKGTKLVRESCYDKQKVESFIAHLATNSSTPSPEAQENRAYYYDILGTSKIEYYPVFPPPILYVPLPIRPNPVYSNLQQPDLHLEKGDPLYIIYDYSEAANVQQKASFEVLQMPISLYDPVTRQYQFGYIQVTIYYRSLEST